jgi:hypothetical protein
MLASSPLFVFRAREIYNRITIVEAEKNVATCGPVFAAFCFQLFKMKKRP